MALGLGLGLPFRRGGAPAFNPANLSSIVDYGIHTDLTRLRTASDGSGGAPVVDDLIGWWRGQLDVYTLIQATTAYKMTLRADGVAPDGAYKNLEMTGLSIAGTNPFTLGVGEVLAGTGASVLKSGFAYSRAALAGITALGIADNSDSNSVWGATWRYPPTDCGVFSGSVDLVKVATRADSANVQLRINGAAGVDCPIGAFNGTIDRIILGRPVSGNGGSGPYIQRWIVCNAELTGADLTNVEAWLAG